MWSYYGSKTNIIKHYPKPEHSKIIEPFAGTAKYSLEYFDREVVIVDKYPVIVGIWKHLQKCSPEDILRLPRLNAGDELKNIKFDCQEELDLMGYVIAFGGVSPRNKVSPRSIIRPNHINYTLNRIASELYKIKHWDIRLGSYEDLPNENATWFIDPPYQIGGHAYKFGNKEIDFDSLGKWCKNRSGQVIVCEGLGATWLPFEHLVDQKTKNGKYKELIYTNKADAEKLTSRL
jgi:site-specific DNA-adenine methylase